MELNSDIEAKFILKLIQDTKKKEINWTDESNDKLISLNNEKVVSKIYKTEINDKIFRIYEYQAKFYSDENNWEWANRIRLELIDTNGITLFEFKYDYSLQKLFNAVRKTNTDIDNFMEKFLNG